MLLSIVRQLLDNTKKESKFHHYISYVLHVGHPFVCYWPFAPISSRATRTLCRTHAGIVSQHYDQKEFFTTQSVSRSIDRTVIVTFQNDYHRLSYLCQSSSEIGLWSYRVITRFFGSLLMLQPRSRTALWESRFFATFCVVTAIADIRNVFDGWQLPKSLLRRVNYSLR